ncbi:MAG: hypothetical protein K8S56_00590 [Candidatus Cloacimonetes bacterium]|nr:hypothetical protein [Candidatus Cloacimonadota bacterium]
MWVPPLLINVVNGQLPTDPPDTGLRIVPTKRNRHLMLDMTLGLNTQSI